jgi:hypothetical protein
MAGGYHGFGAAGPMGPHYAAGVPGTPPGVVDQPQLPPNYDPRLGNVQAIPKRHYDTVLYGVGQTWNTQGEEIFTDGNRCGNRFLCSLKEKGKFSDKKEFHARSIGLTLDLEDPDLYELFHYQLLSFDKQETNKWRIWADQIGAGGGISGFDVNTGAFHLNWGAPLTENLLHLDEVEIFSVERTFKFVGEWMQLVGVADAQQPLALLNAAEDVKKLWRLTMIGTEIGDEANR